MSLPLPSAAAVAVWRRNILVWRKLLGPSLVGNMGEPLLSLVALGFGMGGLIQGGIGGVDYIAFLAAGLFLASAMNSAAFEGTYSAFTRLTVQKTYLAMMVTRLTMADVVWGEVLWCASKGAISSAFVLLAAILLGVVSPSPGAVVLLLLLALLTGLLFGTLSMTVTALAPSYDFFMYYFTLFISPMFLFSGVFFPLTGMPEMVAAALAWLPLSGLIEIGRPLMLGLPLPETGRIVGALIEVGVLTLGMGTLAAALLERRLVR